MTINTLGLPTRDAIGRTSGTVGRFNRFVPAPGQTTGPFPGYLGVGTMIATRSIRSGKTSH